MDTVSATTTDTPNLTYISHENGIHELILKNGSREMVLELIDRLDQLIGATPQDKLLRMLYTIQNGLGPVAFSMQKARELTKKYPYPPKTRSALLYKDSIVMSLLSPSISLLRAGNFQFSFFKVGDRQRAIDWLLK